MFRITRKGDYAVFILSELARRGSAESNGALSSAQDLASYSALNKSLVANLLKDLTRAGFLTSVRGAHGGYRLARSPKEISLAQILQAVEGPFNFVECASDSHELDEPQLQAPPVTASATGESPNGDAAANGSTDCCGLSPLCVSRGPLLILHARIARLLDELSLADLCGLERGGMARLAADMFPSHSASGAPADNNGCASSSTSSPAQTES